MYRWHTSSALEQLEAIGTLFLVVLPCIALVLGTCFALLPYNFVLSWSLLLFSEHSEELVWVTLPAACLCLEVQKKQDSNDP